MERKLKTGAAYHGNRMLSHAITDMHEMAMAQMDVVVHMLSHTDWERHDKVMADIFKASEAEGLEVWVDNWGIGGAPGDKCHFLGAHPEAHMVFGNGEMHPFQICLNSPAYREFVKSWIEEVVSLGGKTVFWDEPHIPTKKIEGTDDQYSCCACPTCRKMFRERYGKEMPILLDDDVIEFGNETLIEFHDFVSSYAKSVGLNNVICFMPHQLKGFRKVSARKDKTNELDIGRICEIKNIDNIGTDPYWFGSTNANAEYTPYEYVYEATKACVETADKYGKDHNLWIQSYSQSSLNREEEIIEATVGAYDAGARTILSWSFHGGESNTYRAANPDRAWLMTVEAFKHVKWMERNKLIEARRKKVMGK